MMRFNRLLLAVALFALPACENASSTWEEPLDISAAKRAGNEVVYLNRTSNDLVVLSPNRKDGVQMEIQRIPVGLNSRAFEISADGLSAYVVDESSESLYIVSLSDGNTSIVELKAAYDRIAQDPSGEYLVLSFSGASNQNVVARNLNEVAVVDLNQDPPSAYFETLSTRPNSFEFAPPFKLNGSDQRMMAVLSNNEITIFDFLATEDDDRKREIPLTISEAAGVRVPDQAIFDVTKSDVADLYLTAAGLDDVSRISIQMSPEGGSRKLLVSTDKLTVSPPSAIALLQLPGGTRMLSLDASRPQFSLVDTVSDVSVTFPLPSNAAAEHLLVYSTVIEDGGETREEVRVLAYSTYSPLVSVIRPETISIDGDTPVLGRSVEAIRLDLAPSQIKLATGRGDQAIVFHKEFGAGFTLLNLARNSDVPIQGGALHDVLFDGLFAYVVYTNLPNLTIFADDGHPTNFDLPKRGSHVFLDQEDELILIEHPSETGEFTVLDANDPRPENTRFYRAVFLDQLFQQEL